MNRTAKAIVLYLIDPRSLILAFAIFNFILVWTWDREITFACVVCPWYHPWSYLNEPSILLVAAVLLRLNRWWGNTTALVLAGYLIGFFIYLFATIHDPVAGLRADWRIIREHYPYIVGSWDSQYVLALIIVCCSVFYLTRSILRRKPVSRRAADNKSLDASGGSVFRIMTGPATREWIRAAASTPPLDAYLVSWRNPHEGGSHIHSCLLFFGRVPWSGHEHQAKREFRRRTRTLGPRDKVE